MGLAMTGGDARLRDDAKLQLKQPNLGWITYIFCSLGWSVFVKHYFCWYMYGAGIDILKDL